MTTPFAYKGRIIYCSDLVRINHYKDLQATVIDDFTVYSPRMDKRVPFRDVAISKRVEMLWTRAYELVNPPSYNGNLRKLNIPELVRLMKLSSDLVNKGKLLHQSRRAICSFFFEDNMGNYTHISQYPIWCGLHTHIIRYKTIPPNIAPFPGFSQHDRIKRKCSAEANCRDKRVNSVHSQDEEANPLAEEEEPCPQGVAMAAIPQHSSSSGNDTGTYSKTILYPRVLTIRRGGTLTEQSYR
jgi:hypothetical protein